MREKACPHPRHLKRSYVAFLLDFLLCKGRLFLPDQRLGNLVKQISFRLHSHQVGIPFTAVIVDRAGLIVIVIHDQKADGLIILRAGLQCVVEQVGRVSTIVDGHHPHSRRDPRQIGQSADQRILNGPVGANAQAQRVERVNTPIESPALGFWRFVVVFNFPATRHNPAYWGLRGKGGQAVMEEFRPIRGRNCLQGADELVKGIGFQFRTLVGAAIKRPREILEGFLAMGLS